MFYFSNIDGKKVLKSDLLTGVEHFFTTRDCCLFSKDKDMSENRFFIEKYLGQRMATNQPVHGSHIEKIVSDKFFYEETDALLLDEGKAASMNFGDCVPMIYYYNHVGMIVHGGWRGTALKIAVKALDRLKADYGIMQCDVKVVIGPAICFDCYEVGEDVFETLQQTVRDKSAGFYKADDKYFVDLKEINYQQLKNSGVEQIDVCPYCTACGEGKDLFYSYRHSHTGDRHSAVLKV